MRICKSNTWLIAGVIIYLCTSIIYSQTEWLRSANNPVLIPGSTGSWDETSAIVNTVLFHNNIYKMWYEGDDGIGYATSPDGIIWTKDSLNNPILEPGPPGSWDEMEINNASVLFKDNIYHMWYSGIDFFDDNRIGYATSPDGINWTKDSLNPVIDHGTPGSWDDEEVMHPFVVNENDTLKMYYNGHNGQTQRILYATSLDGKIWNKYTLKPMLEPGFGGAWDSNELGPLAVVYHKNLYHMWYTGWNFADYIQIGYATSPNGTDWTKETVVLSPGDPGEWDDGAVALPFVIVDEQDSLFKMWYGGTDGILFQTGYATSDLPVGVEENNSVMPSQFSLHQNYPNPFNPSTKIKFTISTLPVRPSASPRGEQAGSPFNPSPYQGEGNRERLVTLKVYDVLGNEVATLVNKELPAGEYEVSLDATGLTSGIYFYQLKVYSVNRGLQSYMQTKKMTLLK